MYNGTEVGQRPVCRVRVYQDGDVRPLFEEDVAMAALVRTTTMVHGLDPGRITRLFGEDVPDSRLYAVGRILPLMAGGYLIYVNVAD